MKSEADAAAPAPPDLTDEELRRELFRTRERLQEALKESRLLQEISTALIPETDPHLLYEKIVDAAVAIMHSDFASLQMFHPERGSGGELHLLAFRGFDGEAARAWEWINSSARTSCGEALRLGKRVVVPDVETSPFREGPLVEAGIRAVQTSPLLTRNGKLVGMLSTHWRSPHAPPESGWNLLDILARQTADLIERTLSERELRESEERFRSLFEQSMDGIFLTEPEGGILDANPAACALMGMSVEEIRERGRSGLVVPDDKMAEGLQIRQSTGRFAGEMTYRRKDGTEFPVEMASVLHPDPAATALRSFVIFRDITERKRAEESEERLRILMDHNPCVVFLKDETGRYAYLNNAYQQLVASNDWYGKTDFDLWPKESAELFRANDAEVLRSGRLQELAEESTDFHGRRHSWLCYKFPFADSKGKRYVGGVAVDVTDRVRAETAILRSDELGNALNRINAVVHSTQDFDEIVKQVLSEGKYALRSETAAFSRREEGRWLVSNVSGMQEGLVGNVLTDDDERHALLAVTSREPVAVDDAFNDLRFNRKHLRRHHVRSVLVVPVIAGGDAIGVLFFNYHSGLHTFTAPEIFFGRQLGTTAAIAFQNARVMEELQRTADALSAAKASLEATVAERTIELAGTVERLKLEVGQRAAAEDTLRKNEALLRTVLETLPVGVALVGARGNLSYVNPALTQIREGEIHDYDAVRMHRPGSDVSLTSAEHPVAITLQTHEPVLGAVLEMDTATGKRKTIIKSVAPILLPDGSNAGAVYVIQDVTRQHELQRQLHHAQKLESIGSLAGGVAHDFNNILTAICGYAEFVYNELEDEDLRDDLRQVLVAGERATELTRKLLAFSRQQVTETEPMSLTETVESVLGFVSRLIGAQIEVRRELAPDRLMIRGSRGQIEQVLVNIILNARDAISDTGTVTVRTGRITAAEAAAAGLSGETRYAFVEIADTGGGIPKQHLDRIFEPYFTTKEPGKGTGLGMAIAYGIVRQHDGAIAVASVVGAGTKFTVYLPLTSRRGKPAPERPRSEVTGGDETVLVVEDEPAVRSFIEKTLLKAGYRVVTAADGTEALATVRERAVDLVLTDVIMPGMNGMEMFTRMAELLSGLKVIFASGYSADIVTAKGIAEEEFRFLQKPVAKATLLAAVREVLDGEPSGPGEWPP